MNKLLSMLLIVVMLHSCTSTKSHKLTLYSTEKITGDSITVIVHSDTATRTLIFIRKGRWHYPYHHK